ncbi:MAG TPA: hypothetical protein PLO71_15845 [Thauera phenylacetica]|jgi:hypothetical protein|nr:hypothetical protein [Thauera phenylacetica]
MKRAVAKLIRGALSREISPNEAAEFAAAAMFDEAVSEGSSFDARCCLTDRIASLFDEFDSFTAARALAGELLPILRRQLIERRRVEP